METKIPSKYRVVDMIPFEIKNLGAFITKNHKEIYPESIDYDRYWLEEIKRCIEGHWGEEEIGSYRYMPGSLYFYGNFSSIQITTGQNQRKSGRPFIRDIDWYITYALAACEGFSGFEGDENVSCFRPLKKLHKNPKSLSEKEKILIETNEKYLRKPDGSFKDYVEAREYLYQSFDKPLGLPLYLNTARNLILLSTRRLGKSYNIVNQIAVYDLTFDGAKTLSEYLNKETSSGTVLGAHQYDKSREFVDKMEETLVNLKYNIGGWWVDKASKPGCVYRKFRGFDEPKNRDKFSKGFKSNGGVTDWGPTGSKLSHVSFNDNISAAVGQGARKIIVEEAGLLDNFSGVHSENSAVQKAEYKYGFTIYIGTGGDIDKIQEIQDAFYDPASYECLEFEDLWENTGKSIGLFVPVYYKNNQFRDKNGNLKGERLRRSFMFEWEEREALRRAKSNNLLGHMISFPFNPSEMFMKAKGNRFQAAQLEDVIRRLENGEWENWASIGELRYVDKKNRQVEWEEDLYGRLQPIKDFISIKKLSEEEKRGAVVVYEHPKPYRPKMYTNKPLYLVVYDPVAVEEEEGMERGTSLACIIVIKLWDFDDNHLSFNIVAEWIGRREMDETHKLAFLLADYYNCRVLPEVMNDDILRYARRIKRYNDLQDSPANSAAELTKGGIVRNRKGFMVPSNKDAKGKLEDFLFAMLETVVDRQERILGATLDLKTIKVVDNIKSLIAAKQLLNYNRDGNFDMVSALFGAGLYVRNIEIEPTSHHENEKEERLHENLKQFIAPQKPQERHPAYYF